MQLSGSRYHLALHCSYPFRPEVVVPEEEPRAAAIIGTEAHSYVEVVHSGGDPSKMFFSEEAARKGAHTVAWLRDVAPPTAVEIAIAYDAVADTARRIETKGHRDYGELAPTEIPTTLDLVWDEETRVIVRDLKTGKRAHAHRPQLIVQALAASRLYRKPEAQIGFLFAQERRCKVDPLESLDAATLEAESWQLASVLAGIPTAEPVTGKHCWWCPARTVCPKGPPRREHVPPEPPADLGGSNV